MGQNSLDAALAVADQLTDVGHQTLRRAKARGIPLNELKPLASALKALDDAREAAYDAEAIKAATAQAREAIELAKRPPQPNPAPAGAALAPDASAPPDVAHAANAHLPVAGPIPAPEEPVLSPTSSGRATPRDAGPLEYALTYAALGWPVLPIGADKRPKAGQGIKHASTDEAVIRGWWARWPDAGVGIHLGAAGLCAIDIDPRNGATKTASDFPATLTARTGGGGWHLIYSVPGSATLPGKLEAGVDIKHRGYIIVEPSVHPSGSRYTWIDFDPTAAVLVGAPEIAAFPLHLLPGAKSSPPNAAAPNLDAAFALAAVTDETIEELRSAFTAIPSDDRDVWVRLGHGVKHLGERGLELWLAWSKKSPKFDADDAMRVWESLEGQRTDYRAVFAEAQRRSWVNPKSAATPAAPVKYDGKPRTAAALLGATFQPIKWTVPRILPEGVYLLAASPKIGKSWLALQISIAVAGAGEVLGQRAECGSVLYLALEDSDRRLQSRLKKLDAEMLLDDEAAGRLSFETRWPRIDEDGGAGLDAWLKAHQDARLVIIDVFERFRAPRSPKGNLYSEDYAAMRAIKTLADKYRVTVLVVHHIKKGEADDAVELVSGTQGLAGGADGVLILKRPRGAVRGELHIVGRDLEDEGAFVVDFQRSTCRWEMVGTTREVAPTVERQAILDALREAGGPLRLSQVASSVKRSPSATSNLLRKLVGAGLVNYAEGAYSIREGDELRVDDDYDVCSESAEAPLA